MRAKLATQSQQWSPPAPAGVDITVEGDEGYTRIGENLLPRLEVAIKIKVHREIAVSNSSNLSILILLSATRVTFTPITIKPTVP